MNLKFLTLWYSKIAFRFLSDENKKIFRQLEKVSLKIISAQSHLSFNETCLNNKLLPKYTNVHLHDEAVKTEPFYENFRENLVNHEVTKQDLKISDLEKLKTELSSSLRSSIDNFRFKSLMTFLQRIIDTKQLNIDITHNGKLTKLYGGEIFMKKQPETVVNLTSVNIHDNIKEVFNLGMNCHLKTRYNSIRKKIEVEKLYNQITNEKGKSNIVINDEESLRCELKRYGLKKPNDFTRRLISTEQMECIKNFNNNEHIRHNGKRRL